MRHENWFGTKTAGLAFIVLASAAFSSCKNSDDDFVFDETFVTSSADAGAFQRVDRMALPAFATALISTSNKDPFNQADPVDDAAGQFDDDVLANLENLHAALDDDLVGLGLTPCAEPDCFAQLGGFMDSGDVLTIDPSQPSGFPNGRRPDDPVIDLVLALVFLDLETHAIDTLANVPVNPPQDDVPLIATFPFLAPPQP